MQASIGHVHLSDLAAIIRELEQEIDRGKELEDERQELELRDSTLTRVIGGVPSRMASDIDDCQHRILQFLENAGTFGPRLEDLVAEANQALQQHGDEDADEDR